jgi:glycerol-3-phosphate cytidylyltransferase
MLLPCKKDIAQMLNKDLKDTKIGFYSTIGDLLHPGHLVCLREAKNHCDYLIVGLVNDPTTDRPNSKNKPVQSLLERYIQLASCKYVDCVIPLSGEQDLEDALLLLLPDVRFAGSEYKDLPHTGKYIENVEMVYLDRKHSFSSTDLRVRVYEAEYNGRKSTVNAQGTSGTY